MKRLILCLLLVGCESAQIGDTLGSYGERIANGCCVRHGTRIHCTHSGKSTHCYPQSYCAESGHEVFAYTTTVVRKFYPSEPDKTWLEELRVKRERLEVCR